MLDIKQIDEPFDGFDVSLDLRRQTMESKWLGLAESK